jgi:hypothetical protein
MKDDGDLKLGNQIKYLQSEVFTLINSLGEK